MNIIEENIIEENANEDMNVVKLVEKKNKKKTKSKKLVKQEIQSKSDNERGEIQSTANINVVNEEVKQNFSVNEQIKNEEVKIAEDEKQI